MRIRAFVLFAACTMAFAGQGWSGERGAIETLSAHVETWRIADPQAGDKTRNIVMTVIRDDDTVEARVPGRPVRMWRKLDDGVELREIDLAHGTMVVHAPGDLRAEQREPDWSRVLEMPASSDASAQRLSTATASAAEAFTDTRALREIDGIDDGD